MTVLPPRHAWSLWISFSSPTPESRLQRQIPLRIALLPKMWKSIMRKLKRLPTFYFWLWFKLIELNIEERGVKRKKLVQWNYNSIPSQETRTPSHDVSGSSGGVACFSMFLNAASFLFIFLASSFSRSRSLASAFSSNYKKVGSTSEYKCWKQVWKYISSSYTLNSVTGMLSCYLTTLHTTWVERITCQSSVAV